MAKNYYVLGESKTGGTLIRCDSRDIAEHELGLIRGSDCHRIARTKRLATEKEVLAWFPAGLLITKRESRFNAANSFGESSKRTRRGRDTLNAY